MTTMTTPAAFTSRGYEWGLWPTGRLARLARHTAEEMRDMAASDAKLEVEGRLILILWELQERLDLTAPQPMGAREGDAAEDWIGRES